MVQNRSLFLAGLFFCTLATLALELLDTRLLSAMTWYHLSFYAVSTAMFGMSAGAVHVYLSGERFEGEAAKRALGEHGLWFALSIPLCHVVNLIIPLTTAGGLTSNLGMLVSIGVLAVPFFLAGILVTISLTRIPGKIGVAYGVDLLGAGLGSLLVLPLLTWTDLSSAVLVVGALAAVGAACWQRFAGGENLRAAVVVAVGLVALAGWNDGSPAGLRITWAKGNFLSPDQVAYEAWNVHSHVIADHPKQTPPFYWGPAPERPATVVETMMMVIDGDAGTAMTRWDGEDVGALDWVQYDVTSLPYQVWPGGDVAVIGVGGGRDILTALWGGADSVTGVEINHAFLHLLRGPLRDFAHLADRPDVTLVHDEARSYFTRTEHRFDVVQMSLVDTWAATGAGAMTLSENGLYTQEGWDVFLRVLRPGGVFSVSRWYDPVNRNETSRLSALAVAALHAQGVTDPRGHLLLAVSDRVVTLALAVSPLGPDEVERFHEVAAARGFQVLASPRRPASDPRLAAILAASDEAALAVAVADPTYDLAPPTDLRPYFFNTLKPSLSFTPPADLGEGPGAGNLMAQRVLLRLLAISALLVGGILFGPLVRGGLPAMPRAAFFLGALYFALIGTGFMLIQIPLMQRFSVYLGHPSYAVPIVLFSMIVAAGVGSFLSDRLPVETRQEILFVVPLAIAVTIGLASAAIQPIIDNTIQRSLPVRALYVVAVTVPVSVLLGLCFPIGMRLVQQLSRDAAAWMWGVNGAFGVLASVLAVAISMWSGIDTSLYIALGAYALLVVPAVGLWRYGAA